MNKALRIAMLVGTLGVGGAEKQLYYIAGCLKQADVNIRVYCLTKGEEFEEKLRLLGVEVIWVGRQKNVLLRLIKIIFLLLQFKPEIVYATHFYVNLYAAISAKFVGGHSIGSLRLDTIHEVERNGMWGKWCLSAPDAIIANSYRARQNAIQLGENPDRIFVLPNRIDLKAFDQSANQGHYQKLSENRVLVASVSRLTQAKRVDRFISIAEDLKDSSPQFLGVIVGDGPLADKLKTQANEAGLVPDHLRFWGHCENIPAFLKICNVLILTSDYEGFPNVVLEAMAAGIPVVAASVGDVDRIIVKGVNGFVISPDNHEAFVSELSSLINSPTLRLAMGTAGRILVEERHNIDGLQNSVFKILIEIAKREGNKRLIKQLSVQLRQVDRG